MLKYLREVGTRRVDKYSVLEEQCQAFDLEFAVKKQTSSDCILKNRSSDDEGGGILLLEACLISCSEGTGNERGQRTACVARNLQNRSRRWDAAALSAKLLACHGQFTCSFYSYVVR